MTGNIQIFHYDNIPTIGEIKIKMKTDVVILKRDILSVYSINEHNLTELKIKIHSLKSFEDGILGEIDLQVIEKNRIKDVYSDYWVGFYFYICSELKILILGGDDRHVNSAKEELVKFFNDSLCDIQEFVIKKDCMMSLVKKIKTQGPILNKIHANIMVDASCNFIDTDAHYKAKSTNLKMYNSIIPSCVSKHPNFITDLDKCETFSCVMKIFKCNGILNERIIDGKKLYLKKNAQFSSNKINPNFNHWIIFVKNTVSHYLVDVKI